MPLALLELSQNLVGLANRALRLKHLLVDSLAANALLVPSHLQMVPVAPFVQSIRFL